MPKHTMSKGKLIKKILGTCAVFLGSIGMALFLGALAFTEQAPLVMRFVSGFFGGAIFMGGILATMRTWEGF